MKVILYMATTIDGLVAKNDDDTSWVSETDWDNFKKAIEETGIIVIGRRTYEAGLNDDTFPFADVPHIVMTSDPKLVENSKKDLIFLDGGPKAVLAKAESIGFDKLLVAGGGKVNAAFLKEGLIDEIILSVHPKILGMGINLFAGEEMDVDLELISAEKMKEDLVQLRYKVRK